MSAEQYKAKGNDFFKAKNYAEAIASYSKALELDSDSPNSGALYSNRAACFTSLGQHQKALEDADRCIRVRPDWLKGYFRRGVSSEALGNIDEALKSFQDAARAEPGNAEVAERITALNEAIKRRNDGASPMKVKDPEEARKLGNSFFSQGKYEQAMGYYSRAIELYGIDSAVPEKATCYCNRAACHQQTHNYQAVIADCSSALSIDANHAKALLRRAIAHEGLEKWQLALDDYNAINRLTPGMSNVSQGITRCSRALRH